VLATARWMGARLARYAEVLAANRERLTAAKPVASRS